MFVKDSFSDPKNRPQGRQNIDNLLHVENKNQIGILVPCQSIIEGHLCHMFPDIVEIKPKCRASQNKFLMGRSNFKDDTMSAPVKLTYDRVSDLKLARILLILAQVYRQKKIFF